MSQADFGQRRVFEGAAARYRALLSNTRDPARRQMLQEMIDRELAAIQQIWLVEEGRGSAHGNLE